MVFSGQFSSSISLRHPIFFYPLQEWLEIKHDFTKIRCNRRKLAPSEIKALQDRCAALKTLLGTLPGELKCSGPITNFPKWLTKQVDETSAAILRASHKSNQQQPSESTGSSAKRSRAKFTGTTPSTGSAKHSVKSAGGSKGSKK